MDAASSLALALDPSLILAAQGMTPDPWQREFLLSSEPRVLLNCSRGAGKSRTTSALALHTALFRPGSLVLILSRAQRQAQELLRYVKQGFSAIQRPIPLLKENESQLEFANTSRIVSLPGKEDTIRGMQGVSLLIIDEGAKVPDDLYFSVRPMLGVSGGRLVALSTPFGQRGWFWREWVGKAPWKRVKVTWRECPRLSSEFIAGERLSMGDQWVAQEYECSFSSMEGLVYPDFEDHCVCTLWPPHAGKPVGGIDFGWRNPFAAIWGVLDRDDVLWIEWERYLRETPLHEHTSALRQKNPRQTMWYADPAGATEIGELRAAGLAVRKGDNDIRHGIAAVTARVRTGRLKVLWPQCFNLCEEAKLYRYPSKEEVTHGQRMENPVDDNNHALGALRYLVSKVDARFIAALKKLSKSEGPVESEAIDRTLEDASLDPTETHRSVFGARTYNPLDDEDLWTVL